MMKVFRLLAIALLLSGFVSATNAQTLFDDLKNEIDIVVAQDGTGDYTKVQEAIDAAPANSATTVLIFIKNGSYYEKIIIPNDKPNLTLIGENVDNTILWYDEFSNFNSAVVNTFTCHSVRVDASDVKIMNVTIHNPPAAGPAVALHGNGDRQTFVHCRVTGKQDTYYSDLRSRNYFKDCFIEGGTDFIFGFGVTLFDSCQVHCNGGVVTAASTPQNYKYGQVFRNSVFAGPQGGGSFELGRPWFDYGKTVLLNCYESEKVNPKGWSEWQTGRALTCYYREYKCTGPGSDFSSRIDFGKQLTDTEAADYTIENIFSADNFNHLEDLGTAEQYFTTGAGKDELASKTPPLTYADVLKKSPLLAELGSGDADILKYFYRWAGHSGEPYLDSIVWRADGQWPVKPTTDWVPDIDTDPVYQILRNHVKFFLDSANARMGDFKLFADGEAIADFDTAVTTYGIELASGATEPAVITLTGDAFGIYQYPSRGVPGWTYATISPYNRIGGKVYDIYNSIDGAYTDAGLTSLTVDNVEILESGVYEYHHIIDKGVTKVPAVKWTKSNTHAKNVIDKATSIPDTTFLTITAPDGVTVNEFKIFFHNILSHEGNLSANDLVIVNPTKGMATIKSMKPIETDVVFKLYDAAGQLVLDHSVNRGQVVNSEINIDVSGTSKGIYIMMIQFNNAISTSRLIVE